VARVRPGQAGRPVVESSAKASTAPNVLATSQKTKLISVHTRDWQDHGDVSRVLQQLRVLGVTSRLSYKTDQATRPGSTALARQCTSASRAAPDFDDRTRR